MPDATKNKKSQMKLYISICCCPSRVAMLAKFRTISSSCDPSRQALCKQASAIACYGGEQYVPRSTFHFHIHRILTSSSETSLSRYLADGSQDWHLTFFCVTRHMCRTGRPDFYLSRSCYTDIDPIRSCALYRLSYRGSRVQIECNDSCQINI